jgi:hypothetical protein
MTLVAIGIYTFIIVLTVHRYEAAIKQYKESIEDYKRALNLAKHHSNAEHYTYLQLENKKLKGDIAQLKAGNSEIQYESSIYKSNTWNDGKY